MEAESRPRSGRGTGTRTGGWIGGPIGPNAYPPGAPGRFQADGVYSEGGGEVATARYRGAADQIVQQARGDVVRTPIDETELLGFRPPRSVPNALEAWAVGTMACWAPRRLSIWLLLSGFCGDSAGLALPGIGRIAGHCRNRTVVVERYIHAMRLQPFSVVAVGVYHGVTILYHVLDAVSEIRKP